MTKTFPRCPRRALLLLGLRTSIWYCPPRLLLQSGFVVDVIAVPSPLLQFHKRHIHEIQILESPRAVVEGAVASVADVRYDWVIPTDDLILSQLRRRQDLPNSIRQRLAPVVSANNFDHLASKIGLAKQLRASGIRTPRTITAVDLDMAVAAAEAIGYPVMVKADLGFAGDTVFRAESAADIQSNRRLEGKALVVQEAVSGRVVDLSALYLDTDLVHFTYSEFLKTASRYGPSSVRRYWPTTNLDPAVARELSALGGALGLHGFATITCIDAFDGSGRYYIEADARPSIWTQRGKEVGDDPSERIRGWFDSRHTLGREAKPEDPPKVLEKGMPPGHSATLVCYQRFTARDLLTNRHGVWRQIPRNREGLRTVSRRLGIRRRLKSFALNTVSNVET